MPAPSEPAAASRTHIGLACLAHVGAILGPVIPGIIWLLRRTSSPWLSRHAAAATNFGFLVLAVFVIATIVSELVPLVAFLGTLAQLVILIVAVALCLQACRAARRGLPATYPYDIKVVRQA